MTHKHRHANLHNSYLCKPTYSPSPPTPTEIKADFPSMLGVLTRCMAELRGGCGSISNWDGVCPKCWICASVACRKEERESTGGKRERLSQSICIKVMGQCVTWQCKQILTQPCLSLRKGGRQWGKGELSQSLLCSPFPHSLQSHPSVSMEETSLFLLTCFS